MEDETPRFLLRYNPRKLFDGVECFKKAKTLLQAAYSTIYMQKIQFFSEKKETVLGRVTFLRGLPDLILKIEDQ